jgi:asparagine N-glycosylation enzyme membrane subunit Stt3
MDDKIGISGDKGNIEISGGDDIKIKGKDNVIKVDAGKKDVKITGDNNDIKITKEDLKDSFKNIKNFFMQKNVQTILVIVLLVAIIFLGSGIRVQNLPLLKDSTTNEYIPLALDPFYFLRIAETMVSDGGLPSVDNMRYPSLGLGFSKEITPKAIVLLWKVVKPFNSEITLRFVDVISPVVFFALGLVFFFLLCYLLTGSKKISLLSSAFLAFIPAYLYRTTAGFADHESFGMLAFFMAMFVYVLSMKKLEKIKINKIVIYSILTALLTAFTFVSWGGVASLLFLLIPLGFLINWILKFKENKKGLEKNLVYYITWVISTIIFGKFLFGVELSTMIGNFTGSTGIVGGFCLLFIIADYLIIKNKEKLKIKNNYRLIYSIAATILIGIISLSLIGGNFFGTISHLMKKLLTPFGTDRISLTVAENAQPYLTGWISQIGKTFFWIFFAGVLSIGYNISKKFKIKKNRNSFFLAWAFLISGILFSRISASSLFNGANFISKLFYFVSIIVFLIVAIKIYRKEEIKIDSSKIILGVLILLSLISVRSASRVFFLIAPFACLPAAYLVFKSIDYSKKTKDDLLKTVAVIFVIILLVLSAYNLVGFYKSSKAQVSGTGPSAHYQWQNAMSWIRENTPEGSNFIHWWDYGYWVQTLGERPTITDGGHGNSYWDHLIGRYLLTTKNPSTALDLMKSHDVSYLLIDPTDLGKYPAYSKIAGNEDFDTFSIIPTGISDPKLMQETANSTSRIYQLGGIVDEDIYYEEQEIFIPGPTFDEIGNPTFNAYVGGVVIESAEKNGGTSLTQPKGAFIYNNKQIILPIRYIYYNSELIDFGNGLESIVHIIPRVFQDSSGNGQIDPIGAVIYLSPKVSQSLFAQLYLLDDAFNKYPSIKLAHAEADGTVSMIQGMDSGGFVYYNGFRGPIKIWEVSYPSETIEREEFLRKAGEYAEFDNLFVKV